MGRLIMWNVVTVDGLFEGGEPWDLSFHQTVWGEELRALSQEQLREASALILGRKTYEGFAQYWSGASEGEAPMMNSIEKIVFSHGLTRADWTNSSVADEPPASLLPRLKRERAGDLYVFGSGMLSQTLIAENLFDEYRLCVAPVILGKGRPLFTRDLPRAALALVESRPLTTGGVILRYRPPAS